MPKTRQLCAILAILVTIMTGCEEKKVNLNGDSPVEMENLLMAFPSLGLPVRIADTNLLRLTDTSITISRKVFAHFVSDSLVKASSANEKNLITKIHPVGKIERQDGMYLLTTFLAYNKQKCTYSKLVVFFFNQQHQHICHLNLLAPFSTEKGYAHSVTISREPSFSINRERGTTNLLKYTRNGYAYSEDAKGFIVVVNESNEEKKVVTDIYSPIDTLPKKNKYSGNYVQDKKNFISIRDGKTTSRYLFFVHFEKNNGECSGELSGEMKMNGTASAVFTEKAGPCVMDFKFEGRNVYVKEQDNCGNHRGVKCLFNDTFTKTKEKHKK